MRSDTPLPATFFAQPMNVNLDRVETDIAPVSIDVLEQALTLDPTNPEADRLRQTVLAQIRLQHAKERAGAVPATQEHAPVPRWGWGEAPPYEP